MSAEGDCDDIEIIHDTMGDPTLYTAQPLGCNEAVKRRKAELLEVSSAPPAMGSLFSRKMLAIKVRDIVEGSGVFSSRAMFPLVIDGSSAKQSLSDVRVVCGEKTFNCHRAILAQQSTTFQTMFTGDFAESETGPVTIEDITGETMQEILRFIYCGYVETDVTNTSPELQHEFIYAAEKYHLKALIDFLLIAFSENLSAQTACRYLIWADRFGLDQFKIACFRMMAKRTTHEAVLASPEWQVVVGDKELMTGLYCYMVNSGLHD